MSRCEAHTKFGNRCQRIVHNGKFCCVHTPVGQCPVCMEDIMKNRGTRTLGCEHTFHNACLEQWKAMGKNTCPICRKLFDVSKFTVQLTVINNEVERSNTITIPSEILNSLIANMDEEVPFNTYTTEISFDVEDLPDLESLLRDLGLTDVNPSVFDTETIA